MVSMKTFSIKAVAKKERIYKHHYSLEKIFNEGMHNPLLRVLNEIELKVLPHKLFTDMENIF